MLRHSPSLKSSLFLGLFKIVFFCASSSAWVVVLLCCSLIVQYVAVCFLKDSYGTICARVHCLCINLRSSTLILVISLCACLSGCATEIGQATGARGNRIVNLY